MGVEHVLVVHGGAGNWDARDHEAALAGTSAALRAGLTVLGRGGSALDAVIAAVVVLEDHPLFNAGTGAALNLAGEAEMDACVMEGTGRRAGAVAAIRGVKNPVLVARRVMEASAHVLIVGEGALQFAREMGFPPHDPVTESRRRDYRSRMAERAEAGSPTRLALPPLPGPGTVGAVALDCRGARAAATSTGGLSLKLPGRVGDTPIPGAGTYATAEAAASATGHGETIMRLLLTRAACDAVARGKSPGIAASRAVAAPGPNGGGTGIIVVDAIGRIGIAHDTPAMPHAWGRAGQESRAAMRAESATPTFPGASD
ncbi:MAG TPA: isoaspartyl peptidase/L-asparaginase [Burkholderiales bacterium]|nr:isoaspartyl peptidase/L-asparaginase [Burkholderiales bacterium]